MQEKIDIASLRDVDETWVPGAHPLLGLRVRSRDIQTGQLKQQQRFKFLQERLGRGLIGVVVAELFGSRAGLGRLISQSADAFNMPELFAGVIVLAVAGIAMTAGFGWVERRLVPWTRD